MLVNPALHRIYAELVDTFAGFSDHADLVLRASLEKVYMLGYANAVGDSAEDSQKRMDEIRSRTDGGELGSLIGPQDTPTLDQVFPKTMAAIDELASEDPKPPPGCSLEDVTEALERGTAIGNAIVEAVTDEKPKS